jgi:hypothetical protein
MNRLTLAYLGAMLWLAGARPLVAQGSISACQPYDANAEQLYQQVVRIATSTDSVYVAMRAKFGIPQTPLNQIERVNDKTTCGKAVSAINSTMSTPRLERTIYLLRVGTNYATIDPAERAGEWRPIFFFNGSWRYLGMTAGS